MPRRARAGEVFSIPLDESRVMYARSLVPPLFEFYDLVGSPGADLAAEEVCGSKCLFRVSVMRYAASTGHWTRIGLCPLTELELERRHWFYKQDPITGALSRYAEDQRTGETFEEPLDIDEIGDLECEAVWDPEHVEDRLRDHLDGRPNVWVESMKPTIRP